MECILNQVDPQFDLTHGLQYRLSILLGQSGFSFAVIHASTRRILKLESYSSVNSLQNENGWPSAGSDYFEHFRSNELTGLRYEHVNIALASGKLTLAPYDFISGDNERSLMALAHKLEANDEIITESLYSAGPVIAIALPKHVRQFISSLFHGASIHCSPVVFVKGLMRGYSDMIARQVFLNVYSGYFEMCIIQGTRLLYLNTFRYSAVSDVIYYVVFVLEQLGFVPSEENITLMGEISGNETVFNQLKEYCASLNFGKKPYGIEYPETFANTDLHRFFTLLNL